MYIAMNRFKIMNDHINDFIDIWKSRNSLLDQVEGFQSFKLLQGTKEKTFTFFISHSIWESQGAFKNWTESEHFKNAHRGAKAPGGTYVEHPQFEGYEVVLEE